MRRIIKHTFAIAALCVAVAAAAPVVRADEAVFDFEGVAPTSPPQVGALTNLVLSQGGLTMTITRAGGGRFDVQNNLNNPGVAPEFGTRSLDPFFDTSATAFIATFSQAVTAVSIDMGDFGQDVDTLVLQAFSGPNGTGTLLDSAMGSLTATGNIFTFTTLSVSGSGIFSIQFIGGSTQFPNSVFYDNIRVTFDQQVGAVPEPATLVLLGTGLAGVVGAARRRRKAREG